MTAAPRALSARRELQKANRTALFRVARTMVTRSTIIATTEAPRSRGQGWVINSMVRATESSKARPGLLQPREPAAPPAQQHVRTGTWQFAQDVVCPSCSLSLSARHSAYCPTTESITNNRCSDLATQTSAGEHMACCSLKEACY